MLYTELMGKWHHKHYRRVRSLLFHGYFMSVASDLYVALRHANITLVLRVLSPCEQAQHKTAFHMSRCLLP